MDTFKEFERKAWEKKASLYTEGWGSVTHQTTEKVLEIAQIGPEMNLLDVGCGPGYFCQQAMLKGAKVIGCDYSSQMIEIASSNFPDINFKKEDAENLSFQENSFDAVTLNYLLLHVPDQKKVLLEAKRILKKDGILIYTVWLPPVESPGLNLILGAIIKHADPSVIPPADDIFFFAKEEEARKFFKFNQFSDFKVEQVTPSWKGQSKEEFYAAVLSGARMGGTIELQKPEIKEQIKTEIFSSLDKFNTGDGFVVPMPSIIVSARKST